MKKIMFNDNYGLTQAVLEGRKTMTRRIVPDGTPLGNWAETEKMSRFKVGEVVAIAQNYEDAGYARDTIQRAKFRTDNYGGRQIGDFEICLLPGWKNKMFVLPTMMPHQIRITDVRVERLQDISDEDVYKEGFEKETVNNGWGNYAHHWEAMLVYYDSIGRSREIRSPYPREAFAALIDKVSGKGTWETNPWVFVYEFELVK